MVGDPTPEPAPTERRFKPMTLSLGVAVAIIVAAGLTRLIPEAYRPYNFTAVGGLALFAAARFGLGRGLLLALGALLISDLALWIRNDYSRSYLPSLTVYAAFAVYAVVGWRFLRRTESPWLIGGVAVGCGLVFFLVTNFGAWLGQALPYGYSLAGLLNCYEMALPFYRGTLTGDLVFTATLFGAHAVLSRKYFPAERVPVPAHPGVTA